MEIIPTIESLNLVRKISNAIDNKTFHHHYHILYDIASTFDDMINYVEIGCYAGGSACLMAQRPMTNVFSIDIGVPIKPVVAINNFNKLNSNNNKFNYLEGNSYNIGTKKMLTDELIDGIDILFIDGGHSYINVINDFDFYSDLVNENGYIVFDDYNDISSPEVKLAVDKIISELNDYEIIGTIKNELGARPAELVEGNCFIIRKI